MGNTLYNNADMIKAMKINKQPSQSELISKLSSNNYFGQLKKDGAWYELEKTPNGDIYLFGRLVSKKTGCLTEKSGNVPHIIEWAKENLPNGSILVGEIYYPGKHSNDVTKIMGCVPKNAIARQKTDTYGGLIHYYIHDIIKYENTNLLDKGFGNRYEILDNLFPHTCPEYIELSSIYDNDLQKILTDALGNGEEGMVFKKKMDYTSQIKDLSIILK